VNIQAHVTFLTGDRNVKIAIEGSLVTKSPHLLTRDLRNESEHFYKVHVTWKSRTHTFDIRLTRYVFPPFL